MAKILVGRDNPKEVEVGFTPGSAVTKENADAEKKEELATAPVEDVQVDAVEASDVPEKAKAAVKGRGKKRSKA